MIDIEKLRKGLEHCTRSFDCEGCPYDDEIADMIDAGTVDSIEDMNASCIARDALALLNDYERLAALHVDLLDKVEALLKTLEEARECTE